jgi:hypothetical protein
MSGKNSQKSRETEQNPAENTADDAVQATQESLDQVRSILFGTQLRDQDKRFLTLEERFSAEFAAFRDETRKSIAALEGFMMSEFTALAARLTTESTQRAQALSHLTEESHATAQRIEKRVGECDAQHAAAEGDIRKQFHEQANGAREELKSVKAELHALVEKLVTDLRSAKTDRAALAGLFNEMAGRLQG